MSAGPNSNPCCVSFPLARTPDKGAHRQLLALEGGLDAELRIQRAAGGGDVVGGLFDRDPRHANVRVVLKRLGDGVGQ